MTRLVVIALAVAALLGLILWQRAELSDARADLAATSRDLADATARLARAAESAAVHRAHVARMTREAEAWAGLIRDLQTMEGRDASLSDHLRTAAGRLWP